MRGATRRAVRGVQKSIRRRRVHLEGSLDDSQELLVVGVQIAGAAQNRRAMASGRVRERHAPMVGGVVVEAAGRCN